MVGAYNAICKSGSINFQALIICSLYVYIRGIKKYYVVISTGSETRRIGIMRNGPQNSFLQAIRRFLAGHQPEPVIDEAAFKEQLNDLLTTISKTFFEPLALLQAEKKEFASSPESKTQARENALSDFHDELNKALAKHLDGSSAPDVANAVLDYFRQHIQQHTPFSTFLSTLTTAFSLDEGKVKALSVGPHP